MFLTSFHYYLDNCNGFNDEMMKFRRNKEKIFLLSCFLANSPTAMDAYPMDFPKGLFILIKNYKFMENNTADSNPTQGKLFVNSYTSM